MLKLARLLFMSLTMSLALTSCSDDDPSFIESVSSEVSNNRSEADALAGNRPGSEDANAANPANAANANGSNANDNEVGSEPGTEAAGEVDQALPPEYVLKKCSEGIKETITKTITFEERRDCSWGENGNLSIKDGSIRARAEQTRTLELPSGSTVCGLDLQSQTQTIHFDDFFAMRVGDTVVAASKVLTNQLEEDDSGLLAWDWSKVVGDGNILMQDLGKYCGFGDCKLPEHDKPGKLDLGLALTGDVNQSTKTAALFGKISSTTSIPFTVTATGDNDAGDCFHSGGVFNVTVTFSK